MARAITNIIENALHAMPAGGTLSISAQRENGSLTIVLADTGIGMDDQATARIFEPYFSTKAIGTGLGLSIAKRNIELCGGSIAIESVVNAGTRVTVTLPAAPRSAAVAAALPPSR